MAGEYDVTTRFKVDISDLKKGIGDANKQIKLANSEFNAVSNGTKEWEHSLDGLSAKIKRSQSILDAQNKKLKVYEQELNKAKQYEQEASNKVEKLKNALEQAKNEFGDNSEEVKKLKNELVQAERDEAKMANQVRNLTITFNNQQGAVNRTTAQLNSLESELEDVKRGEEDVGEASEGATSKLSGIAKGIAGAFGKVAIAGIAAAGAAVAKLTKDAIANYSEYEQVVGGVNKLFGKNADIVKKNALYAYKNQGLSANEYMENVTKFSASLINSLGGDTKKSAEYANRALTDMSDNANVFGSNMEDVQNAYQGFAKGNFTMLDNLKLGYGGTATEAKRLIKDASKMTEVQKKLGVTVDSSSLSFGNVVNAISVMQDKMNISGTTVKESSKTIEGSVNSIKSAWDNLLLATTTDDLNLTQAIRNFTDGIGSLLNNVLPIIGQTIPGIIQAIVELIANYAPTFIQQITPFLTNLLKQIVDLAVKLLPITFQSLANIVTTLTPILIGMLPQLINVLMQMIGVLINSLSTLLPSIVQKIVEIIPQIIQAIVNATPQIIQGVINLVISLVNALPTIIQTLINAIPTIIQTLINSISTNLPIIIQGLIGIINAIVQALPQIIQSIIDALPKIIESVVNAITNNLPIIINGLVTLVLAIVDALPKIIESLVNAMPKLVITIVNAIIKNTPQIIRGFITLFGAVLKAVPKIIVTCQAATLKIVMSMIKALASGIKDFAKWASDVKNTLANGVNKIPEKMRELGKNIVEGLWNGIQDMKEWIKGKIGEMKDTVVDGFKDVFGISSPSKVMRDQIGCWLAKGIASGITRETKSVLKSVKVLSKSTLTATKTSLKNSGFEDYSKRLVNVFNDRIDNYVKNSTTAFKNLVNTRVDVLKKATKNYEKYLKNADKKSNNKSSNKSKNNSVLNGLTNNLQNSKTATKKIITAYTNTLKNFQTKAKKIVNDTLTNITKSYQEKYNKLVDLRNETYNKMLGFGSLTNEMNGVQVLTSTQELNNQTKYIKDYANILKKLKGKIGQNLYTAIASMDIEASKSVSEQLLKMSSSELNAYNKAYEEKLKVSQQQADSLYNQDFKKLNKDYNNAIDKALKGVNTKLNKLGAQAITGFVKGMKSQTSNLSKDIKSISNSIIKQFKKYLKIKSPSKRFANEIGKFIPLGISQGIKDNANSVYNDIKGLTNNLVATASGMYSDLQGSNLVNDNITNNNNNNNTYNFYQTNNSPKALSRWDIYKDTKKQISLMKEVMSNV